MAVRERAGVVALAVALVLGTLAGCAPDTPAAGALRVMTWNVQTGVHDPAEWAPTIAAWRPDVVGLQEVCAGEAEALAALLREDGAAYVAVPGPIRPVPAEDARPVNVALRRPCRDGAQVSYGLAVLTHLPVTAAATELFAPDDRDEQRGYQRVTLRTPGGGTLAVYNTHVGLHGVQPGQIRALADAAGAGSGPAVVLGDLNVAVADPALGPLRARFAAVDPAGRLATLGADRIDHVFLRDLAPTSPGAAPDVTSSDHRPLIVDVAGPAAVASGR